MLVASPVAAQTTAPTITVDDDTPTVGLAVNVTVTCPEPVGFVDGTIRRDPPDPIAANPPSFASQTLPFTFPVTFNVDGNFTIAVECTDSASPNSSASLNLTVTTEQTPTTAPTTTVGPTTTIAPTTTVGPTTTAGAGTTAPVSPTTAAVSPTSAASATTDPGQLPATGTSDSTALIAVILLGLGAMVLLVARKFRPLDD
jgi:LPXTG-motif cell wall-anchored protein